MCQEGTLRTVITAASMGAAFALAMAQGVASAQGQSDFASELAKAVNTDLFTSGAFADVSAVPPHDSAGNPIISLGDLDGIRGGAEPTENVLTVTNQVVNGATTGNTITVGGNMTNGAVNLDANAFSGFAGIGNFVINTGNNNTVQGTLSVQVSSGGLPTVIGVTGP
jgi:hypothetical protein